MQAQRPRARRIPGAVRWLALAALVVAAAALAYLLVRRHGAGQPTAPAVTAVVKHATYQVTVAGPGSLSPIRTVALAPSVGGRIVRIAAVGDTAIAGQALAQLDRTSYQRAAQNAQLAVQQAQASLASLQANQAKADATLTSQIASARASLDAARRAFDSQKATTDLTATLYRMGSASASELQTAQDALSNAAGTVSATEASLATLLSTKELQDAAAQQDLAGSRLTAAQAQLSLTDAQQNLADTSVVAPFAGTVSAVSAAVGETAATGGALVTVIDDATVQLAAQIAEADIAQVAVGQTVSVTFDAAASRSFAGTVSAISPIATLVSNIPVYYVTVDIPNRDRALRGGMTGQASIVTREIRDTFQLPARAVRSASSGSEVMVLQPDGSYLPVPVTVVGTSGVNDVLTGRLPDGATVLVSGGTATTGSSPGGSGQGTTQRRNGAIPLGGGGGFRPPPSR